MILLCLHSHNYLCLKVKHIISVVLYHLFFFQDTPPGPGDNFGEGNIFLHY